MFNRQYMSRLFYVHRELSMACFTAAAFIFNVIAYVYAPDLFVQCITAIGAVVMALITGCFIYGVVRFEKKYGGTR